MSFVLITQEEYDSIQERLAELEAMSDDQQEAIGALEDLAVEVYNAVQTEEDKTLPGIEA